MAVLLGTNQLFRVKLATDNRISAEPASTFSRLIAGGHVAVTSGSHSRSSYIQASFITGSRIGVHVIDDFPRFICDSCEYVKTAHKQMDKE